MITQFYPTRLTPNFGLPDNPPPKRLSSSYGAPKPNNLIRFKTTYYQQCCPNCKYGTIRLDWEPGLNAHSLTCIMCAWTYNQDPRSVDRYV